MATIFISFVHEDQKVAEAVQHYLARRLNAQAFLSSDTWQVFAGEKWMERIVAELSAAKIVILMLSKRSIDRPWVNFEAGGAWLTDRIIIPVCYGNMSKERLPKPYSSIQALDLGTERHYLLASVAHYLGMPPPLSDGMLKLGEAIAKEKEGAAPGSTLAALADAVLSIDNVLKDFEDEP